MNIKKIKKMRLREITVFLIIILLSHSVTAVSIGVTPSNIEYRGVLKGGYAEDYVTITTGSVEPLFGHFEADGQMQSWLSFEPNTTTFNASRDNPYKLKIKVEPPEDTRNGQYTGTLIIYADYVGSIAGRAGGFVKAAVGLNLKTFITGDERIACRAGGFNFDNIEVNEPLRLRLRVINDGNVRISPEISFDIWDQFQENLLITDSAETKEILPTSEEVISLIFSSKNLDIGQYWANIKVDECATSEKLTFNVVEKGGIADSGILEEIRNKAWANTNEQIEIRAKFRNSGQRTVSAKFKGNIKLDNKVVKVIETDEITVPQGESTEFVEYFTPKLAGRYITSGRVVYNNKLTFEKSSVLNVNDVIEEPTKQRKFNLISLLIYLVIIITIIFILRKIVKEKHKKKPF